MAYPRHVLARAHRRIVRSTGTDISLTATAYAELAAATNGPGTAGFDLTLEAQVDDVIECGFVAYLASVAVNTRLDVATLVGGSPVNYFMGGSGITTHGWYGPSGVVATLGPPAHYTIVSGDLASGKVTLRPYYMSSGATARALASGSTGRFEFYAKNLGPADPE